MNEPPNKSRPKDQAAEVRRSVNAPAVGSVDAPSHFESGADEGLETSSPQASSGGRVDGSLPPKDIGRFDGGHRSRVPPPIVQEIDYEAELLAAFESGDPAKVYEISYSAIHKVRELLLETARLRFTANFGTSICTTCDGLKAGPGVLATCFQVQQCNYTNVKENAVSARHLRVINSLLDEGTQTGRR